MYLEVKDVKKSYGNDASYIQDYILAADLEATPDRLEKMHKTLRAKKRS